MSIICNPSVKFPAAYILPALIPTYIRPFLIALLSILSKPVLDISRQSTDTSPPLTKTASNWFNSSKVNSLVSINGVVTYEE